MIHRKADPKHFKNYRAIIIDLLSVVYLLFAKVIVNRIGDSLDSQQPREQAGFRKGYSTMDHIHVVKQVIEKFAEYTKLIYTAFIDYKKTFDSVLTAAVLEALKGKGIQKIYISLIEDICKEWTGRITLHKQSDKFAIPKGVKQGDTIYPNLCAVGLEGVLGRLGWENIVLRINEQYLSRLRFVDDIALLSETAEHMQTMPEELPSESTAVGLKINMNKSKVMRNKHANYGPFRLGNKMLEEVKEHNYIGQKVNADPNTREKSGAE